MSSNLKCVCPRCSFEYTVKLEREIIRSLSQNRLYWGVYLKIIAEELGYLDSEDLHSEFKLRFNPKDSMIQIGQRYGGSTTKMKRKEFTEYLEKIRIWALTEHGIDLPEGEK